MFYNLCNLVTFKTKIMILIINKGWNLYAFSTSRLEKGFFIKKRLEFYICHRCTPKERFRSVILIEFPSKNVTNLKQGASTPGKSKKLEKLLELFFFTTDF